jgi:hypothetical protein
MQQWYVSFIISRLVIPDPKELHEYGFTENNRKQNRRPGARIYEPG